MPRPRVYVETTIPSAYLEERTEATLVARREWTRRWWLVAQERYELVTGAPVYEELGAGPAHRRAAWLDLLRGLPVLEVEPPIRAIVETYTLHKLMPGGVSADALHLALASYFKCDFLATWNYKHLANANKFGHIRWVNTMLGLVVPEIVTPLALLGEDQ